MGSLGSFRKTPHPHCYGVEIECFPRNRMAFPLDTHFGFFYVASDASLEGWEGREFISQPLPFDMLESKIKKLWEKADGWTVNESCGLHVHVSRSLIREQQLQKFRLFLHKIQVSNEQMSFIHILKKYFGRYSVRYARLHREFWSSKYSAVNTLHENSYEFRLWKAGDLKWTLTALNRTRMIVEHKGEYDFKFLNEMLKKYPDPPYSL